MRSIPRWFKRELKFIDPRAEIEYDPYYNFFNIYITVDIVRYEDGHKRTVRHRLLKGCYRELNDKAMADLHYRHWIAQRYNAKGDKNAYMKEIDRDNRDARQKREQYAKEILAEGAKEWGKVVRGRQSWSMGG